MKIADFDRAQPVFVDEVRPGDMVAFTPMDDAKEVQKVMVGGGLGEPPRVWITWAGWVDSVIYEKRTTVYVCMD